MLRHNPYSLLRSTARTNLVERSYSQIFFFPLLYNFFLLIFFINFFINFIFSLKLFFLLFFIFYFFYLLYRLGSLSRVSLCVSFPFFHFEPLNQTLNPGPEIEIDFRQ